MKYYVILGVCLVFLNGACSKEVHPFQASTSYNDSDKNNVNEDSGSSSDTASSSGESDEAPADSGLVDSNSESSSESTDADPSLPDTETNGDEGSDLDTNTDTDGAGDGDSDTNTDTETDTDSDSESDSETSSETAEMCVSFEFDVKQLPIRVMIALDRSGSMSYCYDPDDCEDLSLHEIPEEKKKWTFAKAAIQDAVYAYEDRVDFGIDVYNVRKEKGEETQSMCDMASAVHTDTAPHNADNVMSIFDEFQPNHGTPLLLAIMNFKEQAYAPNLLSPGAESYLLIISDGRDTCGTSTDALSGVPDATPEDLGREVEYLKKKWGLKTVAVGVGTDIEPLQLSAIAKAGGTKFDDFLDATRVEDLEMAMESIAEALSVSCSFEIGEQEPETTNLDLVNVHFDGEPVPRDDGCMADTGWTWADEDRTVIQFCEEACEQLKIGDVESVSGEIACRPEDVIIV